MPTLPDVGGDRDGWGAELNEYLLHEHEADGTHDAAIARTADLDALDTRVADLEASPGIGVTQAEVDATVAAAVQAEASARSQFDQLVADDVAILKQSRVVYIDAGTDLNTPRPSYAEMVFWTSSGGYPVNAQFPDRGYRTDTLADWRYDFDAPPDAFAFDTPWFSETSLARIGIATAAVLEDPTDTQTAEWIASFTPGDPKYRGAWINKDSFSIPVFEGADTDPLAFIDDDNDAIRDGWVFVPADATPDPSSDRSLTILRHTVVGTAPRVSVDIANARRDTVTPTTKFRTTRRLAADLDGYGFGPQQGMRASGVSSLVGLVLQQEIDPDHPDYTGAINHCLVTNAPPERLWKHPGATVNDGAYDAHGYMTATISGVAAQREFAYEFPATEADASWFGSYTGAIKMGACFVIPSTVDLTSVAVNDLGIETEPGLLLARAIQQHGVYVVDRGGGGSAFCTYFEPRVPNAIRQAVLDSGDLEKAYRAARRLTNNTPATPGGDAVGGARVNAWAAPARDNGGEPIFEADWALADLHPAPYEWPKAQWRGDSGGRNLASGAALTITGGVGRLLASTSSNVSTGLMADTPYIRDFRREDVITFSSSVGNHTYGQIFRAEGRAMGSGASNNGYYLLFNPSTKVLALFKRVSTSNSTLTTTVSAIGALTTSTLIHFVVEAENNAAATEVTIRAKAWRDGDIEPAFELTYADSSSPFISGRHGVRGNSGSVAGGSVTDIASITIDSL